ncbi:MAG: DUF1501 domain-containing protein, partial [Planctomycetaceae bacterium]|nr:DUF1501 domain-containing protein [Planctomycetaceae bacterium]
MSLRRAAADRPEKAMAVVQILLTGGASQLETFDPKPHAPREIRGPLHSIATRIPGIRFSECLPRLAERADRLVVLRSLWHDAAPIHQTGQQLLLSGQLTSRKQIPPTIGDLFDHLLGHDHRRPVTATIGGSPIVKRHSPESAFPNSEQEPGKLSPGGEERAFASAPAKVRERYGESRMGALFYAALREIELGTRYVSVNTFSKLEGHYTWDAHGCNTVGPATVFDYRDTIGPQFDRAMAAFLDDLWETGLWDRTLVVCSGEMGRKPQLNDKLGRDHSTQAFSGFLAGGMVRAGQVIGETDEHGESVTEQPIPLSQIPSIILDYLGIAPGTEFSLADGRTFRTP